jgi:ribosomal protein L9
VAAGITGVDKRAIEIPQAVKTVGESEALITIHEGVIATVKLAVVAEK